MDSLNDNYHEPPNENLKHTIDIYTLYTDLSRYFSQYGFFHRGSSLSFASEVMHHLTLSDDSGSIDDSSVADTANIRNVSVAGETCVATAPTADKQHANVDF